MPTSAFLIALTSTWSRECCDQKASTSCIQNGERNDGGALGLHFVSGRASSSMLAPTSAALMTDSRT